MEAALRLATRRSALALAQARAFARELCNAHQGLTVHELLVVTSGDQNQTTSLVDIGGKGLFIKEIEEALLAGQADFAVHSIKDVPAEVAPQLALTCIPRREDPRDVLVSRSGAKLLELPSKSRVGTSSLRRAVSLRAARPDIDFEPVRGNVDTRLRKMEEGQFDAIVLAYAGLRRLGLAERATDILDPSLCLPAVGQGALGIECRENDGKTAEFLAPLADRETTLTVSAERAVMAAVNGNCRIPVAAYAVREGDSIYLRGMLANPDGTGLRRGERRAAFPNDAAAAVALGADLGAELRGSTS